MENIEAYLSEAVLDGVCYQGFKTFNKKRYPSPFGSLNIPWDLSITTIINQIRATVGGQCTQKLFHLQFIWD